MRTRLRALGSGQHQVQGRLSCYVDNLACVTGVRTSLGYLLCDHVWIEAGRFRRRGVEPGDLVSFRAAVMPYSKRLNGHRTVDYKFARPSKVRRCGHRDD